MNRMHGAMVASRIVALRPDADRVGPLTITVYAPVLQCVDDVGETWITLITIEAGGESIRHVIPGIDSLQSLALAVKLLPQYLTGWERFISEEDRPFLDPV